MDPDAWNTTPSPDPLQVPPTHGVPNHIIDSLLGRGQNAIEWQRELEGMHYIWRPILRSAIIRRELWYFKGEIEELLAQPNTNTRPGPKSNSCRSILLRIQGHTGERQQRLVLKRLCGPEITFVLSYIIVSLPAIYFLAVTNKLSSCRTLEVYVKGWRSQPSTNFLISNTPKSTCSDAKIYSSNIPSNLRTHQGFSASEFELQQATMDFLPSQASDQQVSSDTVEAYGTNLNTQMLNQVPKSSDLSPATVPVPTFWSQPSQNIIDSVASDLQVSSTYIFTSTHSEGQSYPTTNSTDVQENILGGSHAALCCCEGCIPSGYH
jgi:hypothetical protein